MDIMEIILLIAGVAVFAVSFLIPEKKSAAVDAKGLAEEEVRAVISQEMASVRSEVEDLMERTERSLEKLSNEKIMAVEEYSDTVLAQIHKDHEEAMFLYDMLNNKHTGLKNSIGELGRIVKEAREAGDALEKHTAEAAATLRDQEEKETLSAVEKEAEPMEQGKTKTGEQKEGQDSVLEEYTAPGGILSVNDTEEEGQNNNDKILALYRQGKSPTAIARELELGVGEVKLVIDLFRG